MREKQKKILIWGAGRIGRGFIGDIFTSAGYELIFVDQSKALVDKLNDQGFYTVVRALSKNNISFTKITNFQALHTSQEEAIQKAVNGVDIFAVAIYPRHFESVAKAISPLIINRKSIKSENPIDIIMCTNLVHAGPVFKEHLFKTLNETQQEYFSEKVGIVESLIIRIAPPAPMDEIKKDPLIVWTNGYSELPVDKDAFKGTPPLISNLRFVENMWAEEKRKMYTYNMCHAILGYYGHQLGYDLLVECLDDPFIRNEVEAALDEASRALQMEYGFSNGEMEAWIQGVLEQTDNSTIGDSVMRMTADPVRKLKKDDRLIGPALLCLKNGINPSHIVKGIGAALHYRDENDLASERIYEHILQEGVTKTIQKISELGQNEMGNYLATKIEKAYHQIELEIVWHKKALEVYKLGFKYEKVYHGCGQCVYAALGKILNIFDPQVFNSATGLCGGIGLMNDATCSAFTGGVLAIGQLFPRRRENFAGDKESKYTNFKLAQKLRRKFENEFGGISCAQVHQKKYGRAFDLQLKEERIAFEEAGGHGNSGCTDTVGKAAQFTIEIITPLMIAEEREKDGKRS